MGKLDCDGGYVSIRIVILYGAGHLVTATFVQWPIWPQEFFFGQSHLSWPEIPCFGQVYPAKDMCVIVQDIGPLIRVHDTDLSSLFIVIYSLYGKCGQFHQGQKK